MPQSGREPRIFTRDELAMGIREHRESHSLFAGRYHRLPRTSYWGGTNLGCGVAVRPWIHGDNHQGVGDGRNLIRFRSLVSSYTLFGIIKPQFLARGKPWKVSFLFPAHQ